MLTGDRNLDMKILNNLDDIDLVKACQTNRAADQICHDQTFWLNRILTKFPEVPIDVLQKYKGDRTWSEYYINDLRKYKDLKADRPYTDLDAIRMIRNEANHPYLKLNDLLGEGAKKGRLDYIILALSRGGDVNTRKGYPLVASAINGDYEMVKYLVEHGADVNIRDAIGGILGMVSNKDTIEYLKSKGAKEIIELGFI